jgi:hypothetical protein
MLFVILWGLLNLIFFFISVKCVYNSKDRFKFIYPWAFLTGSFVWEDLFIFGLFHFIYSVISFIFNDAKVALLIFLIFWAVRSVGETFYLFLEQFIEPKHGPHAISYHFEVLKKYLGSISDQKCYILLQVVFQVVTVLSIFSIIMLLKVWN